MTAEEKKMKRYISAVRRRLELPGELKDRVMSDFVSSIHARQDVGATDAEIYAELGTAKQAAKNLNEQMQEFTYKKSPWRYLFAACAAYGAAKLLQGLWTKVVLWLFQWKVSQTHGASVGIIGGADGPTAIFVTTPTWIHYLIPLLLLTMGIWGFLRLSRCKRK